MSRELGVGSGMSLMLDLIPGIIHYSVRKDQAWQGPSDEGRSVLRRSRSNCYFYFFLDVNQSYQFNHCFSCLRLQEGPLGFLLERLTEMLEGAEAMISIESDIRSKGRNSLFYKETKTYYSYFRRLLKRSLILLRNSCTAKIPRESSFILIVTFMV